MRFVTHADARAFLDRARGWLLEAEAAHTLILGIALERAQGRVPDDPPAWFGTVEEDDRIRGACFRTPPHMLGLTALPPGAVSLVVEAAARRFDELPGVVGDPDAVREAARLWAGTHPVRIRPDMEMGIHELRELHWPVLPAGEIREASGDDLPLLTRWMEAFEADTGIFSTGAEATTRKLLDSGALSVWQSEDGPVAMAAVTAGTPNTLRVSYVYTPPEYRGRGYARAVTAHLSRRILEDGRTAVLYADRDDPAPNHIYRTLGYRRVASAMTVRFEPEDGGSRAGDGPAATMPGTCLRGQRSTN